MAIDKNFYNEASAVKLGWDPSWFGAEDFDDRLVAAIKKWQRKRRLTADGLCGPSTYRRVWTDRESEISGHHPDRICIAHGNKNIIHNGKFYPIEWENVVLWDEPQGLGCEPGTYSSYAGKEDREPSFFVNHWDVCLSASSCARVLAKRGISVHFCIDNDGTIYQLLDTQHAAWQAGGRSWNHKSVGVEISNAYYTKYQAWYVKNGHGPRAIVEDSRCHGKSLGEHLDFYPIQLQALKALWTAINGATGIPLECPTDSNGELVTTVDSRCERGTFKGFINHYNLTKRKIDCAGLDVVTLLDEAKART
jgi:hypothetical protein